ncbi:MAG: ATP-binding protein [Pseudomonadota bacterium]
MPSPDAFDDNTLPASRWLRLAENRLGSGGIGATPMTLLAEQAISRARETGDVQTEALAFYYALWDQVYALPEADMLDRIDAARQHCEPLGVPRALWLLDDLEAWVRIHHGRHMEGIAICQRLDRLPPEARPAFERSFSVYNLSFAHDWLGHHDETLRLRYRFLQLAEQAGRPIWLAGAFVCLGEFLTEAMLDPEQGLPFLQRARQLWRDQPMAVIRMMVTARTIVALDMLGRHQEAYDVFAEDTAVPGAMDVVASQRAHLTLALIGVGRLAEAQAWLDELSPVYQTVDKDGFAAAPLIRLRLLCAQRRYAEARALGEAERDRVAIHMNSTLDRVQLLDHLREACEALGDRCAAAEAAAAAREACLPLVNLSARARYLAVQIERDPANAPPLSAVDERRLEAIASEVRAQSQRAAAPRVPRFLAHVVHELRSPIGGVMGMSSLLLMSDLDEKQRRFTSAINDSASTLERLIDDVLDLAKIERGQFRLNPQPFALAPWLDETAAAYVAQGQAKGVVVTTQLDAGLPAQVVGDALRLRQVLVNLLSNALKFTRQGRVDVGVRRLGATAAGAERVRFEIRDTGTGIAEDTLERLFQEFVQADETIAQHYGGTGLGLALCKQLVEAMGGRIGASSEKGVGSVFWFELDLAPARQPARTPVEIDES